MKKALIFILFILSYIEPTYAQSADTVDLFNVKRGEVESVSTVEKSPKEWKALLNSQEYRVLRKKGTERAFTGKLLKNKEEGIYQCRACGNHLFLSEDKYNSRTGWPSFTQPAHELNIESVSDVSFGLKRTEILCKRCGSHLGHVFNDGPEPTHLRYCINSAALEFSSYEKN